MLYYKHFNYYLGILRLKIVKRNAYFFFKDFNLNGNLLLVWKKVNISIYSFTKIRN